MYLPDILCGSSSLVIVLFPGVFFHLHLLQEPQFSFGHWLVPFHWNPHDAQYDFHTFKFV